MDSARNVAPGTLRVAAPTISGDRSIPVTRNPRRTNSLATGIPVPHPASRTAPPSGMDRQNRSTIDAKHGAARYGDVSRAPIASHAARFCRRKASMASTGGRRCDPTAYPGRRSRTRIISLMSPLGEVGLGIPVGPRSRRWIPQLGVVTVATSLHLASAALVARLRGHPASLASLTAVDVTGAAAWHVLVIVYALS